MHSMAPYWGHFCNGCGLYANMPSHMRSHILRKFAYLRTSLHMRSHIYMPHILHICRIFQRIISPNSVYFPAYFASNWPAYFKKNFRFMVMCLVLFLLQEPRMTTRFHTPNMAPHKMVCLKFEPACKSSIAFYYPFFVLI